MLDPGSKSHDAGHLARVAYGAAQIGEVGQRVRLALGQMSAAVEAAVAAGTPLGWRPNLAELLRRANVDRKTLTARPYHADLHEEAERSLLTMQTALDLRGRAPATRAGDPPRRKAEAMLELAEENCRLREENSRLRKRVADLEAACSRKLPARRGADARSVGRGKLLTRLGRITQAEPGAGAGLAFPSGDRVGLHPPRGTPISEP